MSSEHSEGQPTNRLKTTLQVGDPRGHEVGSSEEKDGYRRGDSDDRQRTWKFPQCEDRWVNSLSSLNVDEDRDLRLEQGVDDGSAGESGAADGRLAIEHAEAL